MSYQCMVPGCPGEHASKWQVCAALDAGRVNAPSGTTSEPVATEPQGSAGESPAPIHRSSNELIASLRDGDSKFRIAAPRSYDGTLARAADEIERLTRQRDHWKAEAVKWEGDERKRQTERDRLRAALSHVKGRAQIRDSATLLDVTRLVDEALSGEPASFHETGAFPAQIPADHRPGTEPLSRVIADLEMTISPDLSRSIADRFGIVEKVLRQLRAAQKAGDESFIGCLGCFPHKADASCDCSCHHP